MKIQFPSLGSTECELMRFCGWSDDPTAKTLLKSANKEEDWMRASTRTKSGSLVVLTRFGVSDDRQHVHIDVAKRAFFGKLGLPGKATTIAGVRKMLSGLAGKQLSVDIEGHFVGPLDQAPTLVRGTRFELASQSVVIKTRAVSLSVEDGPIYSISWRQREENEVAIVIEARIQLTVNESYLIDGFELIKSAYKRFVTGEIDGKPKNS